MNRRGFLSSTMLAGLGLAAAAPAKAFTKITCGPDADDPGCRTVAEHTAVLAKLEASLEEQGLNPEQRKAVLAVARCPTCGSLLLEQSSGQP